MEHLGMYDLKGMSTDRLVELITDKRVSVLEAFGKKRLYRTLLPIRWLVKFALWIIFRKAKTSADARKRAVELLDKFTPYQVHGISLKASQTNQPPTIIGFNHPSLGEIARLISLCFRVFPERPLIFPVTLPWFEMFAPFKHRFDGLGMTITPIITPHATETLLKGFPPVTPDDKRAVDSASPKALNSMDARETLTSLRLKFQGRYLRLCEKTLKDHGIVLLAPSAQRQETIFPDIKTFIREKPLPPVMTMIVRKMLSSGIDDLLIVPICVIPPENHTKMINLFKVYGLVCSQCFKTADFRMITAEDFEYRFYRAISDCPGAEKIKYPKQPL